MKKVLVCGGAGYIGSLVVDKLIAAKHNVTVFDNLLYEERYLKDVNFIYGNISDTDRLVKIANDYDVVVWLAALVGDQACEVDLQLTEEVNHLSVKRFCEKANPNIKLIFFSSCSVYGVNQGLLTEESPVNPLSAYASTKVRAEQHVLDFGGCVFRLGTLFGLGDTYSRIRLDLVVNVMTMKGYLDKEITVNGGEQWRPIISVDDVAEFTLRCAEEFYPGIYILSSRNVTMCVLGEEIAKLTNSKITYNDIPFQDLRNYMCGPSKAQYTFDFKPRVSVETEVLRMYKIFSENRIKDLYSLKYHNGLYMRANMLNIAAKI